MPPSLPRLAKLYRFCVARLTWWLDGWQETQRGNDEWAICGIAADIKRRGGAPLDLLFICYIPEGEEHVL